MNLKRDIKPITYLKNRTADVVKQVSEGRTMVITQNGEAKMVLIGVEEYDRLGAAIALLKIVRHSEADLRPSAASLEVVDAVHYTVVHENGSL